MRDGSWRRVGRGAYLVRHTSPTAPTSRREVALAAIVGVHHRLSSPHWFSHGSAALLWGLPLWRTPASTHVLQRHTTGSRHDPAVRRHVGEPPPDERDRVVGLPVTSLERTALDCATTLSPLEALVVCDAALRAGADPDRIRDLATRRTGRRGIVRARAVLELADPGAESPGETAARFVVLCDGLPAPQTQVAVSTRLGVYWADMGWESWRVLLEYDGQDKYDDRSALIAEKRRSDAIAEAGWRLLRVTRDDLRGHGVSQRVLRLAAPHHPSAPGPRRPLRWTR